MGKKKRTKEADGEKVRGKEYFARIKLRRTAGGVVKN